MHFLLKKRYNKIEKRLNIIDTLSYSYDKFISFNYKKFISKKLNHCTLSVNDSIDNMSRKLLKLKNEISKIKNILKNKTKMINLLKFNNIESGSFTTLNKSISIPKLNPVKQLSKSKSNTTLNKSPNMNKIFDYFITNKTQVKSKKSSLFDQPLTKSSLSNLISLSNKKSIKKFQRIFLPIEPGLYILLNLNENSTNGEHVINQILDLESLDEPIRTVLKYI